MLIFFRMYATHVHDHTLAEALLRDRLEVMHRAVEMLKEEELSPNRRRQMGSRLRFGDLVLEWADYLNHKWPLHRLA